MKLQLKAWTTPIALLALCYLAYGVLIPKLGFYGEDWPVIASLRLPGAGAFWRFSGGESLLTGWIYTLFGLLFGTHKLLWHLWALFLRWAAVLSMGWNLRLLWPAQKNEVTWIAILFAIYPAFTQQPLAVANSPLWLAFCLYFLSMNCMLLSIRKPTRALPLTGLGLILAIAHLSLVKYFIALELLRPIFLWIAMKGDIIRPHLHWRAVWLRWVPYLVALTGVLAWRLTSTASAAFDPGHPILLQTLLQSPLVAAPQLIQVVFSQSVYNLLGVWYGAIQPTLLNLADARYVSSLAFGTASAVLTFVFLSLSNREPGDSSVLDGGWHRQLIPVGLLAYFLGSLPVWLTDPAVLAGHYNGRYNQAALFGLSALLTGLLEWITPRRLVKTLSISLLAGAAVGLHFRSTAGYASGWIDQQSFYWQLFWRAPSLQPSTALLSADQPLSYMGRFPASMALNMIYPQPDDSREVSYWLVELSSDIGRERLPGLQDGQQITISERGYTFLGSSLDSLAIYYQPEFGQCLWVLTPADRYNPDMPALTEEILPISNPKRIEPSTNLTQLPPPEVFGGEPFHTWCYYYEKADLARQLGDWQRVVAVADAALAAGFKPGLPHERLPFIEAYAHGGNWDESIRQTRKAFEKDPRYARQLCYLWQRIKNDLEIPPGASQQLDELRLQLQCRDQ